MIVNDRSVEDLELLDACVARRDGRDDAERPLRNIAYVFLDEQAARAHRDALWLRDLECRTLRKGEEVRLDQHHGVAREEGWW